ncbi:MAG TPA: VOC family protein [Sphingomicrobium sp.]|nr:VOC family protein [Sphingomicrobium sp.]
MSETSHQFRAHAPVLLVRDVVAAHAYFADKLGFRSPRMWGDPPTFCIAQRDGLEVMLNQVGRDDEFRPNGDYDGRCDVYFWVNDADALCEEYRGTGADIVCEPENQPYGMREFWVRDPDGHILIFGHDTSGTAN